MDRFTWKAPDETYQIDDCMAVHTVTCFDENFKNAFTIYEGAAIDKLGYYEDLEEQGKLAVLPCKIGDTIYYIDRDSNVIEEDSVKFFTITKDGIKPILKRHNKKFWEFYEWGKTVFLTKEEAEAKLKEVQSK